MKKTLMIAVGTRPELIKVAPVMWTLAERKIPFYFVHSDQHYSQELDRQIIKNLLIPKPNAHLHVGSGSHAQQTGKVMEGIEIICKRIHPSVVVVHGDTNTTLGSALAAAKLNIPVAHIEAGLRSFDYAMPEEINRMLVDRISSVLFAPTKISFENLRNEGIDKSKIFITGNTIVDMLFWCQKNQRRIFRYVQAFRKPYILATAHRQENVDDKDELNKIIALFTELCHTTNMNIIWPMHPRTEGNIRKFGIRIPDKEIEVVPPVDYFQMIALLTHASLVITDSGGIQEEAYILRKPLLTIRTSTERPETLSANIVTGLNIKKATDGWKRYQKGFGVWNTELGKGKASQIIAHTLETYL